MAHDQGYSADDVKHLIKTKLSSEYKGRQNELVEKIEHYVNDKYENERDIGSVMGYTIFNQDNDLDAVRDLMNQNSTAGNKSGGKYKRKSKRNKKSKKRKSKRNRKIRKV